MIDLIEQNREKIAELCRAHHVRRLSVFGSAARATDFNPETSDVDLLVEFAGVSSLAYAQNYFSLLFSFDNLFARKVELLTEKYVQNPFLRSSIDQDKVVLYAA